MSPFRPLTFLCIARTRVGRPFLLEAKRRGHLVIVLTEAKRLGEDWSRGVVDEVFGVPDLGDEAAVREAVSHVHAQWRIDRIVPMGDNDVDVCAMLREHLRLPGMGQSEVRYFRDKLAMRIRAREAGLRVPEFVGVLHHPDVAAFLSEVPPPWVLKPRGEASSRGITKVHSANEAREAINALGPRASLHLLERFIPGDLYHVDAVTSERKVVFASVQRYGVPLLALTSEGGVYSTRTIKRGSADDRTLKAFDKQVLKALGLVQGVSHVEFIKGADGRFYFLEAAARVGGGKVADVVFEATGVCLWHEWVALEAASEDTPYVPPVPGDQYSGVVLMVASHEAPDLAAYDDPEIVWRSPLPTHAGLIVRSPDARRVETLLARYGERFVRDFG